MVSGMKKETGMQVAGMPDNILEEQETKKNEDKKREV